MKFNGDAEKIQSFYSGIQQLRSIDGVIDIQAGAHMTSPYSGYGDRSQQFTHILQVTLRDVESLERYDKSDLHAQVKQDYIIPCIDKTCAGPPVLAVDFLNNLTN